MYGLNIACEPWNTAIVTTLVGIVGALKIDVMLGRLSSTYKVVDNGPQFLFLRGHSVQVMTPFNARYRFLCSISTRRPVSRVQVEPLSRRILCCIGPIE